MTEIWTRFISWGCFFYIKHVCIYYDTISSSVNNGGHGYIWACIIYIVILFVTTLRIWEYKENDREATQEIEKHIKWIFMIKLLEIKEAEGVVKANEIWWEGVIDIGKQIIGL